MAVSKFKKDSETIAVEMLPAGNGDSLLVAINLTDTHPINLLIDCGLKSTFSKSLKSRLAELAAEGQFLSRLIITHIDADHIEGAIPLLEENGQSEQPNIIKIKQVWHNTFRHIQFAKEEKALKFMEQETLKSIVRSGFPKTVSSDSKEIEISTRQGINLGALILKNKYAWNEDSLGAAVCSDGQFQNNIHPAIKIKILSPSKIQLAALKSAFVSEIRKMGIGAISDDVLFDDAYEFLVARLEQKESKEIDISSSSLDILELSKEQYFQEDKAIPNGSSIAFVLEVENKRLLFLGDAHSSQIETELRKIYPKNVESYPILFDVIKVAHHGSSKNTSHALLKLIDSDKFLISTNGRGHHHPDKETIARIVNRPSDFKRFLYFNYETKTSKAFDDATLKKTYNYEIIYPKTEIKI